MSLNERPLITLPRTTWDNVADVLAVMGIATSAIMLVAAWSDLPASVPKHFDASGHADDWGSRIWLAGLPALSVLLWSGLTIVGRVPHYFNYPWPITAENALDQYRLMRSMLILLKEDMMWIFAYIVSRSIQIAQGEANGLGTFFLPISLLVVFLTLALFMVRSARAR